MLYCAHQLCFTWFYQVITGKLCSCSELFPTHLVNLPNSDTEQFIINNGSAPVTENRHIWGWQNSKHHDTAYRPVELWDNRTIEAAISSPIFRCTSELVGNFWQETLRQNASIPWPESIKSPRQRLLLIYSVKAQNLLVWKITIDPIWQKVNVGGVKLPNVVTNDRGQPQRLCMNQP